MSPTPTNIRAHQDKGILEIEWASRRVSSIPYKFLRCQCPCAACVDEITGERILDVDSVSEDIRPSELTFSGNYALKVIWDDGHSTGLYTWEYLTELCQQEPVVTTDTTIRPPQQ